MTTRLNRRTLLKAGAGVAMGSVVSTRVLAYESRQERTAVRINRDEYGVPHVFARGGDGPAPAFYGYGYAVAEDRLYQLELYRRYYEGRVAEVLGPDWVEFDREARRTHHSAVPLDEQMEAQLDDEHRAVLAAVADGINRYIEETRAGERELHKGFVDNDFEPDPWDAADVAGVFVASMSFFSGFQLETLGAAVLDGLRAEYSDEQAMAIFSDVQWGDDPGAPTSTEQSGEGYVPPYTPAGDAADAGGATADPTTASTAGPTNRATGGQFRLPTDPAAVHAAEMDRVRTVATGLDGLGLPIKLGSNALAVHGDVTESGDSLLMGGPQMGFSTPSVMYEVGLHGPDFDVAGITVTGYPFVMFGHNGTGAFTTTAGIDNSVQTFVESIVPREDGPDRYEFRGEEYEVETVEEPIRVAGGEDRTVTIRRTRHGTVTQYDREAGQAIAQTRGFEGRDMNCLRAFYDSQFAADVEEFGAAARRCDYALNFIWAGPEHIGYFHVGRYPDAESVPWDTRLPADGTRHELTDDDFLRAADGEVPSSVDPDPGYSAQWNNKPAPGWNNGDLSYAWGTDHRVQRIVNLVERRLDERGSVSYDDLKEIVYDISFVDLRAIRYKPPLLGALDGAELSATERAAADALREWDDYRQGDGEEFSGEYPVGYTVFEAFFPRLLARTFEPTFGDVYEPATTFLNYRYGRPTLMRALRPDEAALDPAVDYFGGDPDAVFLAAFRDAVAALREEHGDDVSSWRAPVDAGELDNMALFGMPVGVGDAGAMPFLNRGTENHFVRLGDDVTAENILPPGNDGYVAPDGATADHYDDQLAMFLAFEYKDLLFAADEIRRRTTERTVLEPENRGEGER